MINLIRSFLGLYLSCCLVIITSHASSGDLIMHNNDILKHFPGKTIQDRGVEVLAPDIAENGAVVTVGVKVVRIPEGTHVTKVWFFKDYNPREPIATFTLSEKVNADGLKTRVKLSKSADIILFAELSNGQVLRVRKHVKVTIGGCGGGSAIGYYDGGATPSVSVRPSTTKPSSTVTTSGTQRYGAQAGLLTAGDIDDNMNFSAFLRFFNRFGLQQYYPKLDERITLLVRDHHGHGIQQASIIVTDRYDQRGHTIASGFTGAQGQFHIFPHKSGQGYNTTYSVQIDTPLYQAKQYKFNFNTSQLDINRQFEIKLHATDLRQARMVDIMFVFDTTGSMRDELQYLNQEFSHIVDTITHRYPELNMRFGLTLYRDHGDEYVVRNLGFTNEHRTMQHWIENQRAAGGGDYPEAMDIALHSAIHSQWRGQEAVKLLFLVADAPPHNHRIRDAFEQASSARELGIRIFPVAASGVADVAEQFMRVAAVLTHGRYAFLTDDSGIGNRHAEPKIPCYLVTRLNQLLVRIISSEVSGQRFEPGHSDIIRTIGIYDKGMCR